MPLVRANLSPRQIYPGPAGAGGLHLAFARDTEVRPVAEQDRSPAGRSGAFSFGVVALYFILEYGRPQQVVPSLAVLHLPGLVTAILSFMLVAATRLIRSAVQS